MSACIRFTALCPGSEATETLTLDGITYHLCKDCWRAADVLARAHHQIGVADLFTKLQTQIEKAKN